MKKRIAILIFAILLIFSTLVTVSARDVSLEEGYAMKLKELGLFYGVGENDFDLERAPTRIEALVMLIRVLGAEDKALNGTWNHPFTDVPAWADKYVGYAYEKGLANGVSLTEFGTTNATSAQYLTFMLRALGYSDTTGNDFTWDKPYDLARHVRILPSAVDIDNFWRADVAHVSYVALSARLKNSNDTLADQLIKAKVFTEEKYKEVTTPKPEELPKSLTAMEISEKCADAVFYIEVYSFNGELKGSGSGFFISSDGYAITNKHVIEGARYMTISSPNGMKYDKVTVVDVYEEQDLALLKVDHIIPFDYLEIGDSTTLKQGQKVYAIGSPITLDNTMSEGIISNTRRIIENVHYIQISVPILSGSSGGALIDEYGRVVGVTAAGFGISDLNFVIPIQYVNKLDKSASVGVSYPTGNFYPTMSEAYEFGAFTGIDVISYENTDYGYLVRYNGKDVHEIKGVDTTVVHTADDSKEFCLEHYGKALIAGGFKHAKIDDNTDLYESDAEIVKVQRNVGNNKDILVTAELKPVCYAEAEGMPDAGWYMGIGVTTKESVDGVTTYVYNWEDIYDKDSMSDIISYYVNRIITPKYSAIHTEHKNNTLYIYISGNDLLVTLTANTKEMKIIIEKFNTAAIFKSFDTLAGYIKKNSTSAVNGKYSIKNDKTEDTYMISYDEKDKLISFAGSVKLSDSDIFAYIRINGHGMGTIEVSIKKGAFTSTYSSNIFPGSFTKGISMSHAYYVGQNQATDQQTAISACVTILKRCEEMLSGTSVTLEKLGFTSIN